MRLMYLKANRAWVFMFGSDIRTATIQDMGGFGRFFPTKKEAIAAARDCGLRVTVAGVVSVA